MRKYYISDVVEDDMKKISLAQSVKMCTHIQRGHILCLGLVS